MHKAQKLPFLPGKDFPNEKSKAKNLFANVKDKIQYKLDIWLLKQALKNG